VNGNGSCKARILSASEIRLLGFIALGDSNKMIARKVGSAEATVKVHIKSILCKLGCNNRTQVAAWWTGGGSAQTAQVTLNSEADDGGPAQTAQVTLNGEADDGGGWTVDHEPADPRILMTVMRSFPAYSAFSLAHLIGHDERSTVVGLLKLQAQGLAAMSDNRWTLTEAALKPPRPPACHRLTPGEIGWAQPGVAATSHHPPLNPSESSAG
jgi:DNA-binding CsgD family transcriptional regulator